MYLRNNPSLKLFLRCPLTFVGGGRDSSETSYSLRSYFSRLDILSRSGIRSQFSKLCISSFVLETKFCLQEPPSYLFFSILFSTYVLMLCISKLRVYRSQETMRQKETIEKFCLMVTIFERLIAPISVKCYILEIRIPTVARLNCHSSGQTFNPVTK